MRHGLHICAYLIATLLGESTQFRDCKVGELARQVPVMLAGYAIVLVPLRSQRSRRHKPSYILPCVMQEPVWDGTRISAAPNLWGAALRRTMFDYNYYSGLGIVGETLPQFGNRVKLHDTERGRYGLPIAHVLFGHHENDQLLIDHATGTMREILRAARGEDFWDVNRTAHLMGTCRMGSDANASAVNVPNLFVCDASVFPTSGGVNVADLLGDRRADGRSHPSLGR